MKQFGFLPRFLCPGKCPATSTKQLIFKSHFCNYWYDGMAIWNIYFIESTYIVKRKNSWRMKSESQSQCYCVRVYLTLKKLSDESEHILLRWKGHFTTAIIKHRGWLRTLLHEELKQKHLWNSRNTKFQYTPISTARPQRSLVNCRQSTAGTTRKATELYLLKPGKSLCYGS